MPGQSFSIAEGVSADGRVVGGYAGFRSFTWRAETGRRDFGLDIGAPVSTRVEAISGDGTTVVGMGTSGAFKWTESGGVQHLGQPSTYPVSRAMGVSGDASVIVGYAYDIGPGGQEQFQDACRWTPTGGAQLLGIGSFSIARGVSRDGGTIVGELRINGDYRAYKWTETGGLTLLSSVATSGALAASADGSIVVGAGGTDNSSATMWIGNQAISLGLVPGYSSSIPLCVNDAGTVVGGLIDDPFLPDLAAVWTPQFGMERLTTYLDRYGVAVPAGWEPRQVTGVSADGSTFVGYAQLGTGSVQAFVATVPCPPSCVLVLALAGVAARRRRT